MMTKISAFSTDELIRDYEQAIEYVKSTTDTPENCDMGEQILSLGFPDSTEENTSL